METILKLRRLNKAIKIVKKQWVNMNIESCSFNNKEVFVDFNNLYISIKYKENNYYAKVRLAYYRDVNDRLKMTSSFFYNVPLNRMVDLFNWLDENA